MTNDSNLAVQSSAPIKERGLLAVTLRYLSSSVLHALYLAVAVNLLYAIGWSSLLSLVKIHGATKAGIIGGATLASSVVMWLMFFITLLPTLWMIWRAWSARFWRALAWLVPVAVALAAVFSVITDWVLVHAGARIITWALAWLPEHYTGKVVNVERVLAHGVSVTVFMGLSLALLLALVLQWATVRLYRRRKANNAAAAISSN